MGKIRYAEDSTFVQVSLLYANKSMYLQKEVYNSFKKMHAAALQDGVTLSIVSGSRNFNHQKYLWDKKWNSSAYNVYTDPLNRSRRIMRWLAAPGTSRHHWGTDIDLDTFGKNFQQTKRWKKTYAWLKNNACKFGFFQPFDTGRNVGYQEEQWHWSYFPLADLYLKAYLNTVSCVDIYGFDGAASTLSLNLVQNYVLSINPFKLNGLSCYELSIYK